MGTVIDELIVALKLDPKNFNKGQKEAGAAFLKTRDQAIKSGKDIETSANKVAASIQKMAREVIVLFGAIAGARSLKDLVAGLTSANAELGRFSANMAESPQTMAAWSAAAQRFGGTGTATAETIQRMGKALYDLRFQGKALPQAFYQLEAATGRLIQTDKGPLSFLEQTSAALKELAARDPARAFNIAQELGIDNGTYNLMKEQGAAIHDFVAEIEKSISPSNKAIEAAQKLQAAWATFVQQMGAAANKLYETLGPPITELIDKMNKWLEANREWLASGITDAVKQFADALGKIDWTGVGNGFGNFAKAAADTAGSFKAIVDAIAVMSTWLTGTPLKAAPGNPDWERDWKEKLGGKGAADLPAEAPLNSKVFNEWLTSKADSNGPTDAAVDGRPVSKSNPLPVAPVTNEASGGGFWSNLWKGITGAMSGASPGMLGGGSSLLSAGGNLAAGSNFAATGRSAGERGWWTKARQRQAYQMLTEGGVSPHGAKGLISRWMNVEASGGPGSVNSIGATGIAQWLGARKTGMLQHARELGKDWRDFETQVKYVLKEINSGKAGGGSESALRTARNDREGAIAASRYERAEGYNPRTGVDNFTGRTAGGMRGMDSYLLMPEQPGVAMGAKGSAAISSANNDNRRYGNNNVSSNMTIGNMNIQTQAADPHGIADVIWGDIDGRMKQSANATAANYGPA